MRLKKIRSVLVTGEEMETKYQEIYTDSEVWLHKGFDGEHALMLHLMRDRLPGTRVIDVGCGAGRLSLYASREATFVEAFDFSESAIALANHYAAAIDAQNVRFSVADAATLESFQHIYDLALLAGVLEHVEDPGLLLRQIACVLRPGGLLLISCPGFNNFRGDVYMTLLTILDLPMSLADVRQVGVEDIRDWAEAAGFELERTVGALYELGWGEKAVADMVRRVPAALRDRGITIDDGRWEDFRCWMSQTMKSHRDYLDYLHEHGILSRLALDPPFSQELGVLGLTGAMRAYLLEDTSTDPWFTDVPPFCYQGGDEIYLLRKLHK